MLSDSAVGYTSSNLRKHNSANPLQRRLIDRFHRTASGLLSQIDARVILDAGCGEGLAMHSLFEDDPAHIIGLDGSAQALQVASQFNPTRAFLAGDLLHLPFPDGNFDLVVCMEVLEHLDEPAVGLAELCRVSSGWLLLTVPHEPLFRGANFLRGKNMRAWGNDPGHVNHWSTTTFRQFVSAQCHIVAWRRSFPWTLVLASVA